MTSFLSLWLKQKSYESVRSVASETLPGVTFQVRKVSLQQRIQLSERTRELTLRHEFLRAGDPTEQLEAALADLLVEKLYLEWALVAIQGLTIDDAPASVAALIDRGPEKLTREISAAIRAELALSDDERKN